MKNLAPPDAAALEAIEPREWLESLDYVIQQGDHGRVSACSPPSGTARASAGVALPFTATTPYINTIAPSTSTPHPGQPGDRAPHQEPRPLERAGDGRARQPRVGRHRRPHLDATRRRRRSTRSASTTSSAARSQDGDGDISLLPGPRLARHLRARVSRRPASTEDSCRTSATSCAHGGGLSSYPHPWLMPDFWEFPTVSMGLGPLMAIYQARFNRYLRESRPARTVASRRSGRSSATARPTSRNRSARSRLAAREKLDNLIFVINCNLQRLDGPVRGNGQIIQELEAAVPRRRLERHQGALGLRLGSAARARSRRPARQADGRGRRRRVPELRRRDGAYLRKHFFGTDPRLLEHGQAPVRRRAEEAARRRPRSGEGLQRLPGGGRAQGRSRPSILARTIKGYGLGEAGEGKNITHQQKKMNEADLRTFRDALRHSDLRRRDRRRAVLPAAGRQPRDCSTCASAARRSAASCRRAPSRAEPLDAPTRALFEEFAKGTEGTQGLDDDGVRADAARSCCATRRSASSSCRSCPTRRARSAWSRSSGRSASTRSIGQLYEPVDMDTLLYYKEAKDGQILEEGITEAGSMSSFIAAGTAYATHGVNTIPFFIYYSMFGFQRVGDFIWAARRRARRGFLLGGTAGRTTLAGEGLQHQDGHSHVLALTVPTCRAVRPGLRLRAGGHHPGRHPPDVRRTARASSTTSP